MTVKTQRVYITIHCTMLPQRIMSEAQMIDVYIHFLEMFFFSTFALLYAGCPFLTQPSHFISAPGPALIVNLVKPSVSGLGPCLGIEPGPQW